VEPSTAGGTPPGTEIQSGGRSGATEYGRRDLAQERTTLASERTLLAWYRTSFGDGSKTDLGTTIGKQRQNTERRHVT
jgi:hypothetical protein